jgi:lipopolysaccharide export system permease protein
MKILDRYVLGEFLRTFLMILGLLTILLLMKEVFAKLPVVMKESPPFLDVLRFFVYAIPSEIIFAIPATVILAMMFSIGMMAKNKEALAIHASGISYVRLARPLCIALIVITALTYLGSEFLVPVCQDRAFRIQKLSFEKKSESILSRNKNVTTKGVGSRFYTMKNFDSGKNVMEFPTITELSEDGGHVLRRYDAESAQLVEQNANGEWVAVENPEKDHEYQWEFVNGSYREFDPAQNYLIKDYQIFDHELIPMEENLDRFLATNRKSTQMTLQDLWHQAAIEAKRGQTEYYTHLMTQLHERIALPLATFLLGMLGYTFAVRASIRSLVREFGFALSSIVLYYALKALFGRLGTTGMLPPMITAWLTTVLFVLAIIWNFKRLNQVPR